MPELPALYLPWVPGGGHRFARRLKEFAATAPPGSVLVLHAPTGAGKTRTVMEIARASPGVLLCVPTNALASEVEETARDEHGLRVARWNADAFPRKGIARHLEMIQDAQDRDLVVANPDLMHLFAQHEDAPGSKASPAWFGMKNLDLLVFDEYHAYDERVLASTLLHILRARHARDHRQRFVFMSATPDDALLSALEHAGVRPEVEPLEAATTTPLPPEQGRMIKGLLRVEVSGEPILSSLPERAPAARTLFVFSTFLQHQAAVQAMRDHKVPEENVKGGFVQITGRKTRSTLGQDGWDEAPLLLATSKVDVGLNVDGLERVVMEPGWSEQQFWQRFGRAGRGRPGSVVLHFEDYPEDKLAPLRSAAGYEELAAAVGALLRPESRHVATILRFMGAYAAAFRANTRPSHDREALHPDNLPPGARQAYVAVERILRKAQDDPLRDEEGGSLEWRDLIQWTLRGLRGRALEVEVEYAWSPGEVVRESLAYVRTRTEATEPPKGEPWRVARILPRPKEARLRYRILDGEEVGIPTRGRLHRREFRRLPDRIQQVVCEELDGNLPPFWDGLVTWLGMVPADEIPPVEVSPDDIFL